MSYNESSLFFFVFPSPPLLRRPVIKVILCIPAPAQVCDHGNTMHTSSRLLYVHGIQLRIEFFGHFFCQTRVVIITPRGPVVGGFVKEMFERSKKKTQFDVGE